MGIQVTLGGCGGKGWGREEGDPHHLCVLPRAASARTRGAEPAPQTHPPACVAAQGPKAPGQGQHGPTPRTLSPVEGMVPPFRSFLASQGNGLI